MSEENYLTRERYRIEEAKKEIVQLVKEAREKLNSIKDSGQVRADDTDDIINAVGDFMAVYRRFLENIMTNFRVKGIRAENTAVAGAKTGTKEERVISLMDEAKELVRSLVPCPIVKNLDKIDASFQKLRGALNQLMFRKKTLTKYK